MSFAAKTLMFILLSFNLCWAQSSNLKEESLKLWEQRDVKESLKQAIKKFEQLNKEKPKDPETLVYLMRGHFLLGDAHTDNKDEKLKHFETAFDYGDQALATNEEYAKRLKKNDEIKHAVKALELYEVPQMYWTAASLGKFARANGILSSLKYKNKILALISRVEELKRDYFYGAVDRYWGSYYAVIPGIAGKDLKKSKKHFEKSLNMAPEYLGTKVLKAETYFIEKDDKDGFKKILTEVINDSAHDNHPEIGPENRLEKQKAKKLLDKAGDLF